MSRWVAAGLLTTCLTALLGCGDDTSVAVCFGDVVFCNPTFDPVAKPGADQTVVSGDVVTLDGSNSQPSGSIKSYSWAQTGGPAVALSNANNARATFVAPIVVSGADLTFRLTVVNEVNQADTGSTLVTVQAPAAAALATALALLEGALQPVGSGNPIEVDCEPATRNLPPDLAAAQRGLWLAARSIAIAKGVDDRDPSAFLDASRVLVAAPAESSRSIATQIETFGFMLLGSLTEERDPALRNAVAVRLRGAATLDDPAALLAGRSEVTDATGIALAATPDSVAATTQAVERLLASRSQCVDSAQAIGLTSAGLRVIADAATAVQ